MRLRSVQILGGLMKMMPNVEPTAYLHVNREGKSWLDLSLVHTEHGSMVRVQQGEAERFIPLSQCIVEPELGETLVKPVRATRNYIDK